MVRVVCEFCQTVYNIPETKLTKPVTQATCKVCQNKIIIRREPGESGDETTEGSGPAIGPAAPLSTRAATPQRPESWDVQETELSNSWREAIVDNRQTSAMLKKIGVSVPHDLSTAAGPKAPAPSASGVTRTATAAATAPAEPPNYGGTEPAVVQPRPANAPRSKASPLAAVPSAPPAPDTTAGPEPRRSPAEGAGPAASAALSALAGLGALAAAAAIVRLGGASTLTGLAGMFAAVFAGSAALGNALLRRRGILAVIAIALAAGILATAATAGTFFARGENARELSDRHPSLAPALRKF